MKQLYRILFLFSFLVCFTKSDAQYGNEWIDYGQTYYKLKAGSEGIYRISKAVLDAAGVPASATGARFMLFRNGEELPIYVTTNGSFGTGDYIEFYGRAADGKLDKKLYRDSAWHPDDRISMFSDTAAYYLTYNSQSGHLRYAQVTNNIPGNPPPAVSNCWAVSGMYFKNELFQGRNNYPAQFFPSSEFDNGEGFVDQSVYSANQSNYILNTPGQTTAAANAQVNISVLRSTFIYSPPTMPFKIYMNGQQIADSAIGVDATKKFRLLVPPSLLSASNNIQLVPNTPGTGMDVYGVSMIEVKYPRNFDVSNLTFFVFSLTANSSPQYLELNNFNHGGVAPRLYDLTNNEWYAGDITVTGKTRFYLEPSLSERSMVLYAANSNSISTVSGLKAINFTDFSTSANQGDYIIVTHKNLMALTNGHNYIQDYKDYRASANGGSRNVVVADVAELYDQFAYGNEIHPLSIRNFLQFAYDSWPEKPGDVFIIGRGLLYSKYKSYLQNPNNYSFSIVPTFGEPGSDVDFVNFGHDTLQKMNIGRLSAWNAAEVSVYLDKVKGYEAALKISAAPTEATELWKKRALHIAGSSDLSLQQNYLLPTLNLGRDIIRDTSMGAVVTTVAKNTTDPVDLINSKSIDSLINNGLSLITFHGHASSSGFDFNLNNPEQYNSSPRFPTFLALGCDVSQIFTLSNFKTISEKYIESPNGGSIIMLAADNLGFITFHRPYLLSFYSSLSRKNYGESIGTHYRFAYDSIMRSENNPFMYTHLESMLLQGDPAIHIFSAPKPDYHIAAEGLSSIPANVTTTADSFRLNIIAYNLAKAIKDTVNVKVEHINPAGATTLLGTYKLVNLYNTDTSLMMVPVDKIADLGLNKYRVTIDYDGQFDETSESNNTGVLELFIYSDNLIPVHPQEFSIVNKQNITLKASTLNPFRPMGRYKLEIDTTERFNSPLKQQTTVTSPGGVIKWTPTITYQDSVVYYWRTSFDSSVNGVYQWAGSSFIYLANGSDGWNQSHYYQYLKNGFNNFNLDSQRRFQFQLVNNVIKASNAVLSDGATTPYGVDDSKVMVNGVDKQRFGCYPYGGTIQFMVFDSLTAEAWENEVDGTDGAYPRCLGTRNTYAFEFSVADAVSRDSARRFLENIPNGNYVLVRNIIYETLFTPTYVDTWKNDTLIYGPGNSLYQRLKDAGFPMIDSFYKERVFIFMRKKGSNAYPVYQYVSADKMEKLEETFLLPGYRTNGTMNSTVIGPAKEWKQLKWRTSALDNLPVNDSPYVRIFGINPANLETQLYAGYSKDTSLSYIDAETYPNIRLEWYSYDSVTHTSPQLDYWRVLFSPVPEAALNPAAHFAFQDSLHVGEMANFSVAIENLTDLPMDSMLVRYKIINAANVTQTIGSTRYRKLPGNDTLHANFSFDPKSYPGTNVFFVEANPDKDQPEQYHPNNLGYIPLRVITDERNPLIDVTFDGVHILDRDIVSGKPYIKIALKDENKYLSLDDTSLLSVSVRYPSDPITSRRGLPFDGTIVKFLPDAPGGENEALIEYRPTYVEDGIYELFVNGKDKTGNEAGKADYQVSFEVINKSTITNILNYPNPFSTSTAFVFTITGSRIPSQFKIQVLTVTGKVVREITKNELGPLHIGRNITEYKWDGKDQYGQMLGNGVYLYRVVTAIDGTNIEHRESGADKFYKNGYGKMYIMR
jgi:hypothetical protein